MGEGSPNPVPEDLTTYLAEIEAENHQGDVSSKDVARMLAIIRRLQQREIPVADKEYLRIKINNIVHSEICL